MPGSKINYREIKKIIDLMEERNLSRFEIEIEGLKIHISRNISPPAREQPAEAVQPSSNTAADEPAQEIEREEKKDNLHYITSPMVGTFYRAPDPSSPPFIEEGDEVRKNQVLCIIEAMKLMNEIESDVDGVVTEILVENGKPIEYGQKLISIQPFN